MTKLWGRAWYKMFAADAVLAIFALGGALATMAMFLAAKRDADPLEGKMYGQIPLSSRYAGDDATSGAAARQTKATN